MFFLFLSLLNMHLCTWIVSLSFDVWRWHWILYETDTIVSAIDVAARLTNALHISSMTTRLREQRIIQHLIYRIYQTILCCQRCVLVGMCTFVVIALALTRARSRARAQGHLFQITSIQL